MKKATLLIIGLLVPLGAMVGCAGKASRLQEEIRLYDARMEENNRKACIPGCLLFEGDSNVELIEVQNYFKAPACNYGRRGSTTEDLLKRVSRVKTAMPAAIVMLVGGNDLLRSFPLETIEKNYIEIIGYYKTVTKKIFCVSNLPVSPKLYSTNNEIIELNRVLQKVCASQGVTFVNVYPRLFENGGLNLDYSRDPVHLNKSGQDRLIAFLKKYLGMK